MENIGKLHNTNLNLVIPKQEDKIGSLFSSFPHHPPDVIPPVTHGVRFCDLDLKQLKIGYKRS